MSETYDAIIVGAGPAGSIAARVLAGQNLNVLVIEKRQEIGAPKRCAEGLSLAGMEKVGVTPDPKWAVQEIDGAVVYAPSGKNVVLNPKTRGYILERKVFEKHLARDAIKAGARYLVKATVTGLIRENEAVTGVTYDYMGETRQAHARIVMAADGRECKLSRMAGLKAVNKMRDYHSGYQYEMAGLTNIDEHKLHIFFGNKAAPLGYIWVFPKGDSIANVGIGILGSESTAEMRAQDYLDDFIATHPEIFGKASPIEINGGGVSVSSGIERYVADGFMAIGDAAQLVNPIHGGGIANAMESAKIAAEVAAEALKERDVSGARLNAYQERWDAGEGAKMKRLMKLRHFLEKLTDKDFEKLADMLEGEDILRLTEGSFDLFLTVLKNAPTMLSLARKYITS